MSELIKTFTEEFLIGVKETPRLYFAPLWAIAKAIYQQAVDDEEWSAHSERKKKSY